MRGKKPASTDMLIFPVLLRRLLYGKNHKLGPSGLRQMIFAIRYARKTVKICQTSAAAGFFFLCTQRYDPAGYSLNIFYSNNRLLKLAHKNRAAWFFQPYRPADIRLLSYGNLSSRNLKSSFRNNSFLR